MAPGARVVIPDMDWQASGLRSRAMTYDDMLALARRFDGQTLETVTGKPFEVGIYLNSVVFTPKSSGRGQSDGRAAGEKFVERYNATGSLHPGDYVGLTRNASYYVGLLLRA